MSDASAIVRDFFLLEPEALDQSVEAFRALHAIAPVALVEPLNLYVVTGYDALKEVTTRTDDFSSRAVSGEEGALKPALLSADPPVHSRHKRLAGRAFSPTALRPRENDIRSIADRLIYEFIEDGRVEFVSQFALKFPVVTIAALLGVPIADEEKFVDWAFAHIAPLGKPGGLGPDAHARNHSLMTSFAKYFDRVIRDRRAEPRDDFISTMVAKSDEGDVPLEDGEMLSILRQLLTGGIETTAKLLTSSWEMLLRHPDQYALVKDDRSLIPNMLEESLRLKAPVHGMFRIANHDAEVMGCRVPKGAMMFLAYSSAGRDPSRFENPDVFDIRRKNASRHMAFGYGPHKCIGLHLGVMQARIAFEQLLARLDDVQFAPENKFEPFPSFVIQGLNELLLTFKPTHGASR
ncbi:MAG TPA: cytochrome P450 [Gemmatimonadetes bacterium]|nr:cytochrome P450 [Gemmatimonadota bacterium]